MYSFIVEGLAVTIKMMTVNFPLDTPNVNETVLKNKNFPDLY